MKCRPVSAVPERFTAMSSTASIQIWLPVQRASAADCPSGPFSQMKRLVRCLGQVITVLRLAEIRFACAGANCVVDVVGQPEFLEQVRQKGAYFKDKLSKMPHVKEIRQMGLMIGFDLDTGTSAQVAAQCVGQGLLVLTAKQAVRLLPPLNITYEEIDQGFAVLEQVF